MTTTNTLSAAAVAINDFEHWMTDPRRQGETYWCYHIGELARDKRSDPVLAAVADHVRLQSNVSAPIVSKCGHPRGWEKGENRCRLVAWRDPRGVIVHAATRAH